jgi:hypothetical protein
MRKGRKFAREDKNLRAARKRKEKIARTMGR